VKKIVSIEGMSCGHCAMRVESKLKEVEGVSSAKVDLLKKQAEVEGENLSSMALSKAVVDAGYQPISVIP